MSVYLSHLFLSPGHNYFGHHGQAASGHPMLAVDALECVAGRGLRGDRFFDYKPDYKGQITFFAWEDLLQLWDELGVPEAAVIPPPHAGMSSPAGLICPR